MDKNYKYIIDQLGIITSGLCAIHCALIPVLLSLGLIGGLSSAEHGLLETVIIVISSCLGIFSIYNGLRGHGRIIPQLLIGCGALIIITGLLSSFLGHGIMAVGGLVLLYGHWLNWRQLTIYSS